jgi:hypothetical protein
LNAASHILIQERAKRSEPWNSTKGIYADFSAGFDKPKYYCRCPNCNYVHGHYTSPREAILKRRCPGCDRTSIEKLKKEIRKVDEPVKRVAAEPQRIFVESLVENILLDDEHEDPKEFVQSNAGNLNTWDYWLNAFKQAGFKIIAADAQNVIIENPATGNWVTTQGINEEPDAAELETILRDFEEYFEVNYGDPDIG